MVKAELLSQYRNIIYQPLVLGNIRGGNKSLNLEPGLAWLPGKPCQFVQPNLAELDIRRWQP